MLSPKQMFCGNAPAGPVNSFTETRHSNWARANAGVRIRKRKNESFLINMASLLIARILSWHSDQSVSTRRSEGDRLGDGLRLVVVAGSNQHDVARTGHTDSIGD